MLNGSMSRFVTISPTARNQSSSVTAAGCAGSILGSGTASPRLGVVNIKRGAMAVDGTHSLAKKVAILGVRLISLDPLADPNSNQR